MVEPVARAHVDVRDPVVPPGRLPGAGDVSVPALGTAARRNASASARSPNVAAGSTSKTTSVDDAGAAVDDLDDQLHLGDGNDGPPRDGVLGDRSPRAPGSPSRAEAGRGGGRGGPTSDPRAPHQTAGGDERGARRPRMQAALAGSGARAGDATREHVTWTEQPVGRRRMSSPWTALRGTGPTSSPCSADASPLQAIDDGLLHEPPDEIILSTLPWACPLAQARPPSPHRAALRSRYDADQRASPRRLTGVPPGARPLSGRRGGT